MSAIYDANEYLVAGLENQAEWWEHLGDAHRDYAALAREAVDALNERDRARQELKTRAVLADGAEVVLPAVALSGRDVLALVEVAKAAQAIMGPFAEEEREHGFPFNFALRDAHRSLAAALARLEDNQ